MRWTGFDNGSDDSGVDHDWVQDVSKEDTRKGLEDAQEKWLKAKWEEDIYYKQQRRMLEGRI